jgi:hypothetical protein
MLFMLLPGGVRTGGYPKAAPISGPLGCQRLSDWDMLWSPARSALRAVPLLKPGQLVSAVPGMYSLTKKVCLMGMPTCTYAAACLYVSWTCFFVVLVVYLAASSCVVGTLVLQSNCMVRCWLPARQP